MLAKNRVLFSLIIAFLVLGVSIAVIFWARGFKPNLKKGTIERTGIIVATSSPTGAQVYLDERLTSATNTNIAFLEPKTYRVKILKDGYTVWEKDVEVKADLATEINALLFPIAPQIKPLTTTGATNPSLSPDGTKIAYGTPGERGGLVLLSMNQAPLPFRQETRVIIKNQITFDFSKSNFIWNPNSRQVIARFTDEDNRNLANLLVDIDKSDQEPLDITAQLTATLASWQEEINTRTQTQALTLPDSVKTATSEAQANQKPETLNQKQSTSQLPNQSITQLNYFPTGLVFSPDEEKVLFKNKEGRYQIYDTKLKKLFTLPEFTDLINIAWYPDSNHLIIAQKDLIVAIETDGNNKTTIYQGKFENGFVFAHPSGNSTIILTTLTQPEGTPANLYSINLK